MSNSLSLFHFCQDPKKYIRTILNVYNKYECIVREQFKKEVGFKAALEKACSHFINNNAVTDKAKNSNFSAEWLAAYCNILLKKSNKSMDDTDVEVALDEIMIIFRFIGDKDVFEGFYKRRLAERLVIMLCAFHSHFVCIFLFSSRIIHTIDVRFQPNLDF